MLKLNIEIEGKTEFDLELAVQEVARKVSEGFTSGFDGNEDGEYRFNVVEVQPGSVVDSESTPEK